MIMSERTERLDFNRNSPNSNYKTAWICKGYFYCKLHYVSIERINVLPLVIQLESKHFKSIYSLRCLDFFYDIEYA